MVWNFKTSLDADSLWKISIYIYVNVSNVIFSVLISNIISQLFLTHQNVFIRECQMKK